MNGKIILDTNIIIALFAEDSIIHNRIANTGEVFVPCIAIGELYFGAYKSRNTQDNLSRIEEFAIHNTVLPCDIETAKIYGDIKNSLKEKGQPIPENDMWIAAITQQYALTLVTKDSHFNLVKNLEVELW
ncbi:MAG: type II toxin-antitoxin system VapC family toxin [Nitrospinae bacterium]|nr:type II toxin-antitoxin system VapC family toxin [Nitrospinota bacterium]